MKKRYHFAIKPAKAQTGIDLQGCLSDLLHSPGIFGINILGDLVLLIGAFLLGLLGIEGFTPRYNTGIRLDW